MKVKTQQRGVTSIEYALMAALIALVIITALTSTGSENGRLWSHWTALVIAAIQ